MRSHDRDDPVFQEHDLAISAVRVEVADAVGDIYEAVDRLKRILDTRMPELRKKPR